MITKLDASHKCVLKHWGTIDQIVACREQVEGYVMEIAGRALGASKQSGSTLLTADNGAKKGYVQLVPKVAAGGNNPGDAFFGLGIEGLGASNILFPTPDGVCRAYVYCAYEGEKEKSGKVFVKLVKMVPCPVGFALGDLAEGYLFVKPLLALPSESFADPKQLEHYFTEPLSLLVKWWETNSGAILKALK